MPENTQEYKIEKAEITAEHDFGSNKIVSGDPIDIKNMIGEISMFEDIQKGYITAQIGVLDDVELIGNILKIQGREKNLGLPAHQLHTLFTGRAHTIHRALRTVGYAR